MSDLNLLDSNSMPPIVTPSQPFDLGGIFKGFLDTLTANASQLAALAQQKAIYAIAFVIAVVVLRSVLVMNFNVNGAVSWVVSFVMVLFFFGVLIAITNWSIGA